MVSAALGNHIVDVVGLSSEEQMINSDTLRIVTSMEHEEPIGDRSVLSFPRITMNWVLLFIVADESIPTIGAMSSPIPAVVSFCNLLQESFFKRAKPHRSFAGFRAVPCFRKPLQGKARVKRVLNSAMLAFSCFRSRFVAFELAQVPAKLLKRIAPAFSHYVNAARCAFVSEWHGGILLQPGRKVNQAAAIA